MFKLLTSTALALSFFLGACSSDNTVGEGPIHLSPRVEKGFERYLETFNPIVFAVSEYGNHYAATYCKDYRCLSSSYTYNAIKRC